LTPIAIEEENDWQRVMGLYYRPVVILHKWIIKTLNYCIVF